MNKSIILILLTTFLFTQEVSVTNVTVQQRHDGSKIVDIYYDLIGDMVFPSFDVKVYANNKPEINNCHEAGIAGFGIGLVVMADIMMGGPLTGAAMNPARWAGTWLFGDMENNIDLIIYTVGPILGSLLGILLWDKMMDESIEES